eukprot:1158387-Pelagomonas_calceolata.AAC.2
MNIDDAEAEKELEELTKAKEASEAYKCLPSGTHEHTHTHTRAHTHTRTCTVSNFLVVTSYA